MNVLGLCSGVGGLDLGVKIAVPGARSIAYVEREAYAAATLVARMEDGTLDEAPVWSDLATFDAGPWRGQVDCVISGDPCQPNSVAGKGGGANDDRWLIDRVLDIFAASGATRFFRENVPGNTDGQLKALVPALERLGCNVAAGIFSAAQSGASHRRERLFIMADRFGKCGERQRLYPRPGAKGCGETDDFGHGRSMGNTQRAERRESEPAGHQRHRYDAGRAKETDRAGEPIAAMGNTSSPRRGGRQSGASGPVRDESRGPEPGRQSTGLADSGGTGHERCKFSRAYDDQWDRSDAHGPTAKLCGPWPVTCPGPASPDWPEILDADPLLAPALGTIDLWAIARRNLGLPPLEPDTWDRHGGMARGMDQTALTAAKSMVCGMADGLAPRNDRLRTAGNGVFPLAAALAWLSLDARLREGR